MVSGTEGRSDHSNGLRGKQAASGGASTVYIFSGSQVIAGYENAHFASRMALRDGAAPSAPTREYISSGSAAIAKIESSSTTYFLRDHPEASGSNRILTDSTGNVVTQSGHYLYGESWQTSGTTSTKWLFTTYERDGESGNDYAQARAYINRPGRFNSPDLLGGDPGDPQSLNHYSYVENDPADLLDPSGADSKSNPCGPFISCVEVGPKPQPGPIGGIGVGNGPLLAYLRFMLWPSGSEARSGQGYQLSQAQLKALADCVNQIFQITLNSFSVATPDQNGSFSGTTGNGTTVSVATDAKSYSTAGLNMIRFKQSAAPSGQVDTTGLTISGRTPTDWFFGFIPNLFSIVNFAPSTNYVASGLGFAGTLTNQVHELGHSLASAMNLPGALGSDGGDGPWGDALEKCFGEKSAQNAKR